MDAYKDVERVKAHLLVFGDPTSLLALRRVDR